MVVWANHRVWEEPAGLSAAGHGCMGATSRVRREAYARFCERQGVRLPLPTRRTFAWLNRFRRLVVRYERLADVHLAFLDLACALICLRFLPLPHRF